MARESTMMPAYEGRRRDWKRRTGQWEANLRDAGRGWSKRHYPIEIVVTTERCSSIGNVKEATPLPPYDSNRPQLSNSKGGRVYQQASMRYLIQTAIGFWRKFWKDRQACIGDSKTLTNVRLHNWSFRPTPSFSWGIRNHSALLRCCWANPANAVRSLHSASRRGRGVRGYGM